MAVISKFNDTRCEVSRSVQHRNGLIPIGGETVNPTGIIYNTKLSTTLNIKIGRVSKIQGLQGTQGTLAWDSTQNINTILHNELAMYGGPANTLAVIGGNSNVQGMWYDGEESTQSAIAQIAKRVTDDQKRHNAPKMYDVIEYNIPITLAKILESYVDCCCEEGVRHQGEYSVQYDILNSNYAAITSNPGVDQTICEGKGNDDAFNTPSFRFQEYGVGGSNPSDNILYTGVGEFVLCSQGAISALKNKFSGFTGNFHGIQGNLDYMGTQIHYNIDFYIRIFEAASVQQSTGSACNVNTTITILPVGYISFVEPEDGYTYRAPIYGGVSVKNYLPSTTSNILFAKAATDSSFKKRL